MKKGWGQVGFVLPSVHWHRWLGGLPVLLCTVIIWTVITNSNPNTNPKPNKNPNPSPNPVLTVQILAVQISFGNLTVQILTVQISSGSVGWVIGRTCGPWKNMCRFSQEVLFGNKRRKKTEEGASWPGFTWKTGIKRRWRDAKYLCKSCILNHYFTELTFAEVAFFVWITVIVIIIVVITLLVMCSDSLVVNHQLYGSRISPAWLRRHHSGQLSFGHIVYSWKFCRTNYQLFREVVFASFCWVFFNGSITQKLYMNFFDICWKGKYGQLCFRDLEPAVGEHKICIH